MPFFFFGHVLELLPNNDRWFETFPWLHRMLAHALLALIALHVAGTVKQLLQHRGPAADVLRRML